MGVQGWNRFLYEEGYLPDDNATTKNGGGGKQCTCGGRTSLWRQDQETTTTDALFHTIIPRGSTLHIDGNGLAFYLHQVAYARHVTQVLTAAISATGTATAVASCDTMESNNQSKSRRNKNKKNEGGQQPQQQQPQQVSASPCTDKTNSTSGCAYCACLKKANSRNGNHGSVLSAQTVRRLLPLFLPLHLLQQVTQEYVETLQNNQNDMNLIIYWDGDQRHVFKQATDQHRQMNLSQEWSLLRVYLETGVMPTPPSNNHHHNQQQHAQNPIQYWETHFPRNRLWLTQIKYTLQQTLRKNDDNLSNRLHNNNNTTGSQMMVCREEADAVMARAARDNPKAFVVGQDSDFCFFPGINYIPIGTMNAATSSSSNEDTVVVSAVVLQRRELARTLDLLSSPPPCTTTTTGEEEKDDDDDDDAIMVELAILLGNDYIDSMFPIAKGNGKNSNNGGSSPAATGSRRFFPNVSTVVDFLRNQEPGYRVRTDSVETDRILDFIRNLYNGRDPSNTNENDGDAVDDDDDDESQLVSTNVAAQAVRRKSIIDNLSQKTKQVEEEQLELLAGDEILPYHESTTLMTPSSPPSFTADGHLGPYVPSEVPVELLTIDARLDRDAKDAILRCLQAYLDILTTTTTTTSSSPTARARPLTQEQLDVFREMPIIKDTSKLDFFDAKITAHTDHATSTNNGTTNRTRRNKGKVAGSASFHGIVPQQLHQHVPKNQRQLEAAQHAYNRRGKDSDEKNAWQPLWQDIPAAYIISRMISIVIGQQQGAIAHLYAPFQLFSQEEFHARLWARRRQDAIHASLMSAAATPPLVPTASSREYKPSTISFFQQQPQPYSPSLHTNAETTTDAPVIVPKETLPIDEHEQTILDKIARNQVTIIQGETGCGKSSRIPVMLLKSPSLNTSTPPAVRTTTRKSKTRTPPSPPSQQHQQVRLFLAQPRRIAAKSLVERIRSTDPDLRNQIALRMGHGISEYETSQTRAWFVTTGYLVRVMANNKERFRSITHIIIDEVHERSVDTDILCLLCRRLLQEQPHLRLVLMSATLSAAMYQDYFDVPEPPIKVGAKRYPIREVFLEDLMSPCFMLQPKTVKMAGQLLEQCDNMKCRGSPPMSYMDKLFSLVANLAVTIGQPGSAVLIFVPGMNEIIAITELIEQLFVPGVRFTCLPVHSEIPFEDQMNVFDAAAEDECRIIIATNSAESSVTLPALDHVICLGLCKQIVYNEMSHRQMLLPTWISRASATQRAGRTGRLRPGTVYRCYSRNCYNNYMMAHEPGEMLRIPLDSVILMLKGILSEDDGVTDALLDCLEPPNISTIDRSFKSLHQSHFITTPNDEGKITTLGSFVSALGIDLSLGSLIGLGIQFGVGPEAIAMAGVLSFPKSPWVISNALIHSTNDYNSMTAKAYVSRSHFDANLYSEPLAAMNLMWEYEKATNKMNWCWKYAIAYARIKRLASTCFNLQTRVAGFLGIPAEELDVEAPPVNMPDAKITILRVIQVWCFHDTLIEYQPRNSVRGLSESGITLELQPKSGKVTEALLNQVLSKERHPYEIRGYTEIEQTGNFKIPTLPVAMDPLSDILPAFEERLLSLAIHDDLDVVWVQSESYFVVYLRHRTSVVPELSILFDHFREHLMNDPVTVLGIEVPLHLQRGFRERACGLYRIVHAIADDMTENEPDDLRFYKFAKQGLSKKKMNSLDFQLDDFIRLHSSASGLSCDFKSSKKSGRFCLKTRGSRARTINAFDRRDLFPFEIDDKCSTKENSRSQSIFFEAVPNSPMDNGSKRKSIGKKNSSWQRPLFECIPEGARVLSVLASGRRRDHHIRFDTDATIGGNVEEDNETIELYPDPSQSKITFRWKRFGTDTVVYVQENSVPASAVPMDGVSILYCSCANTLEVRGGGLRAEGLTLLPPGKLFLLLCRFSFGLYNKASLQDGSLTTTSIEWLSGKGTKAEDIHDWKDRIDKAIALHSSTSSLGEELVCFPDSVEQLLSVFDGLNGTDCKVWEDLHANPFSRENLSCYR